MKKMTLFLICIAICTCFLLSSNIVISETLHKLTTGELSSIESQYTEIMDGTVDSLSPGSITVSGEEYFLGMEIECTDKQGKNISVHSVKKGDHIYFTYVPDTMVVTSLILEKSVPKNSQGQNEDYQERESANTTITFKNGVYSN